MKSTLVSEGVVVLTAASGGVIPAVIAGAGLGVKLARYDQLQTALDKEAGRPEEEQYVRQALDRHKSALPKNKGYSVRGAGR